MVFSLQILGVPTAVSSTHGLAALVVASALMAGCGQKGPLFIATPPTIAPASSFITSPTSAASAPR